MRVVILAPIDNSPYSRAVVQRCINEPGIEVAGIVVRRIFNAERIRSELRRDGARLVRKAWKKLVLGSDEESTRGEPGFLDAYREAGGEARTLSVLARASRTPIVHVDDHNGEASIAALAAWAPDVVAFTGGGIVRAPLLDVAGMGIFNAHMGVLPEYRGMDVVEWPILEDEDRSVGLGVTLHFMDRGIDTGPIALVRRLQIRPADSVERLRKRYEPLMVESMIEGLRRVRDGTLETTAQAESDGRQYYIMHPRFYDEVRRRVAARHDARP